MQPSRTGMFIIMVVALAKNPGPAVAVVMIDTITGWDGVSQVIGVGEPDTAYFGQSFVALDARIDSISFLLDGLEGPSAPDATEFRLLLAPLASAGDRPDFDSVFYESGDLTTTSGATFEYYELEIDAPVVPGNSYMWILDAFVLRDGLPGYAGIGVNPGSYAMGDFLYWNTPPNPYEPGGRTDHDDEAWHTWAPNIDAAFEIVFTPEPSTILILLLSCGCFSRSSARLARRC